MTRTKEVESRTLLNIDIILDALNIEYNQGRGRFFFPCPIHGSDNYSSLTIYDSGNWICFTRQCNRHYQYGIFGFVSAVKKCTRNEAINFCENVLNGTQVLNLETKPKTKIDYRRTLIPRSSIVSNANPNIEFYLRRGYSKEILEKYDVFICSKRTSLLYGRIVFPIYDNVYENAIGFVGRTLAPKCDLCGKFHLKTRPCPKTSYDFISSEKWLNSRGFARNNTLFNLWFAKNYIKESGEVILVEGKGDVLKLEMANIHNSLAMFGTAFTSNQAKLLDELAPKRLYIATDADDAGHAAFEEIRFKLKTKAELIRLVPTEKDFGDMTVNEINNYFSNI